MKLTSSRLTACPNINFSLKYMQTIDIPVIKGSKFGPSLNYITLDHVFPGRQIIYFQHRFQ